MFKGFIDKYIVDFWEVYDYFGDFSFFWVVYCVFFFFVGVVCKGEVFFGNVCFFVLLIFFSVEIF